MLHLSPLIEFHVLLKEIVEANEVVCAFEDLEQSEFFKELFLWFGPLELAFEVIGLLKGVEFKFFNGALKRALGLYPELLRDHSIDVVSSFEVLVNLRDRRDEVNIKVVDHVVEHEKQHDHSCVLKVSELNVH